MFLTILIAGKKTLNVLLIPRDQRPKFDIVFKNHYNLILVLLHAVCFIRNLSKIQPVSFLIFAEK